jgi:hypothetical protein
MKKMQLQQNKCSGGEQHWNERTAPAESGIGLRSWTGTGQQWNKQAEAAAAKLQKKQKSEACSLLSFDRSIDVSSLLLSLIRFITTISGALSLLSFIHSVKPLAFINSFVH